jgi:hypothetical protein
VLDQIIKVFPKRTSEMDKPIKKARIVKKRPCKVCRRWFRPNPRVGDDQMTCGDPQCKKEWHRRKCAEWNRKNREHFKGNYLRNKILAAGEGNQKGTPEEAKIPRTRFRLGLPWEEIQEAMGLKQLVIIEYIIQVLMKRFQEVIKAQPLVNNG